MADAAWKKLNEKIKAKRTKGTKKDPPKNHRRGDELTVQRLSAEVAGKAQKYTRIGPREFVPFDESEEMTIGNIKSTCERHFLPRIGKNLVCDILAGEQGPSCKSLSQIPDLKVVYVRFIPDTADSEGDVDNSTPSTAKKRKIAAESLTYSDFRPPPSKCRSSPSKLVHSKQQLPDSTKSTYYPRSLSISDMIKLGKTNTDTATTIVRIFRFDMEVLSWSKVPTTVEFYEEKEAIGTGAFRKAFKATSKNAEFAGTTWVIKHYLPSALKCISDTGQTVDQHNRKVVQMHLLARNFASQLEAEIKENEESEIFGTAFKYRKIFHGETEDKEYVTVEEFIPGQFKKYINNTGQTCVDRTHIMAQKAECLTHFTYERSKKKLMLVDIQGTGYDLFDPEIASTDLLDETDKQYLYCTGNLSQVAISTFVKDHTCSVFCNLLRLPAIEH